ncbi:MAG: hypothetical protein PHU43_05400 [Candidatus Bipolaricaulis sp.]|nr:hypothetical protein [Candidatus Bipolaricaulis sp.]
MRAGHEEVIDASMLETLALIAAANDRSLVEELNRAVQAYVAEQLPSRQAAGCIGRTAPHAEPASLRSP